MKTILFLAAASTLCVTAPALAKQQSKPPIVVMGSVTTLHEWTNRATGMLERNLRYPGYLFGRDPHEGVVRVGFRCSDSGAPTSVAVTDSSGFRELDGAAMRAVSNIRTLHPLPAGMSPNQRYQAVILFAKDAQSYDRQIAAIRDEAARRNAWFGTSKQVVMGISAVPAD